MVHVFDVAQTDGEPLPDLARPQGDNVAVHALDRLKALVAEKGIALEYAETLNGAFGMSCGGTIKLALDVRVVRELQGVISAERAKSGIVVTSGRFTREAEAFAERTPIRLIDGEELIGMIGKAQTSGRIRERSGDQPSNAVASGTNTPTSGDAPQAPCPQCGAAMVRRIAKKGPNAGSAFLGCSRFPDCKGTRSLAEAATR